MWVIPATLVLIFGTLCYAVFGVMSHGVPAQHFVNCNAENGLVRDTEAALSLHPDALHAAIAVHARELRAVCEAR